MDIVYLSPNYNYLSASKEVYTMGNFDGVHRGHQKLLELTQAIANKLNTTWGVITFVPNTKYFFNPHYKFLASDHQKLELFKKFNVPKVLVLDFNLIYRLSSQMFLQECLLNLLQARALVVGCNFKLGKDLYTFQDNLTPVDPNHHILPEFGCNNTKQVPECTETLIQKFEYVSANNTLLDVYSMQLNKVNKNVTSSSYIKTLLQHGNIRDANHLLGYNYKVSSTVIRGQQLGRTLGFPTINLRIPKYAPVKYGIYATRTTLPNGIIKDSVSNFGIRPTIIESNKEEVLETFIFDYQGDLYDQVVSIEFVDYIREEQKFNDFEELVAAITKDVIQAKEILLRDRENQSNDNEL